MTAVSATPSKSTFIPMLIIGILFFVFGFVTWLNGSLIPFLKIVCELSEFEALLVTFTFYIAYTLMALPSAMVLKYSGYKKGMVIGLGIMVLGSLMFIPAAQVKEFSVFLLALFILGTGLTLLQTASNPYIVCIGPRESAAMRISIMGLINKGAGVVVPIIFTTLILTGMHEFEADVLMQLSDAEKHARLDELSNRLVVPYVYMAVVLLGLALFIQFSALTEPEFDDQGAVAETTRYSAVLAQYPHLVLGALTLFTYVGVEVIAGDTIGLYGQSLGLSHFGMLTSYTMVCMVLGYLIGVLCIPRYLSQEKALMASAIAGLVFSVCAVTASETSTNISAVLFGWSGISEIPNSVLCVALLGLANALVWPAVWPLALADLGKHTATGSAILIMGISGGAIIPLIYGHLAESFGNQVAYVVNLPCYAMILFYALKGHKIRR